MPACLYLNVTLCPACTRRSGAYLFQVFEMIGASAKSCSQSMAVTCGVRSLDWAVVAVERQGPRGLTLTLTLYAA